VNWRCISDLEVSIRPITVFLGRNASGKSSLAYAIYLLTRATRGEPIDLLLWQLYGAGPEAVARVENGVSKYPIIISVDGARVVVNGPSQMLSEGESPWVDAFLFPSHRVSILKMASRLKYLAGRPPDTHLTFEARTAVEFWAAGLAWSMIIPLLGVATSPSTLLFLSDVIKLSTGIRPERRINAQSGSILTYVHPFIFSLDYMDPYLPGVWLPAHLAPDGAIDDLFIRQMVERMPRKSLLIIEEPEIFKNPLTVKQLIEIIVSKALESESTIIMTTHDDIVVWTLTKLVEERKIGNEHIAVYYLERGEGNPWTSVRELKIYEDGTIEELPDYDTVMRHLY